MTAVPFPPSTLELYLTLLDSSQVSKSHLCMLNIAPGFANRLLVLSKILKNKGGEMSTFSKKM